MKTFILTMVLFIASTNATSVPAIDITSIIEDCGSTGAKIDRLFLEGQCDVSNPLGCIARKGTSIKGSLSFTATAPTNSLQCSIFGQMPGFPTEMPFPGGCPVPNACDSMLMSPCPIEAGKHYTYGLSMDIGYTFPRGPVTGKWTLKDASGQNFICFKLPMDCKGRPVPKGYIWVTRKGG